jgi:hypothetical protein
MELADLLQLIDTSTQSAFRLETLRQYLVPQEAEEFADWRRGNRKPLATPSESEWLARLRESTNRGYRWYRARVLDYPLSEYSEYELYHYQANRAAGEDIYVADRASNPDLRDLREDFWLIDDTVVVRMVYDQEGYFIRPELVDEVEPYLHMQSRALGHAVELEQYLREREPQLIA